MSNILITGATGFVGSVVLKHLFDNSDSFEKIILTKHKRTISESFKISNSKIEIYEKDLTEFWELDFNIDLVLNFAGDGSQNPYSKEAGETFLQIGRRLIEFVSKSKSNLFHASSGGVQVPKGDHSHRLSTFSYYRKKVEEEIFEAAHANSFNAQIGRLYSFVGPYFYQSKPNYMINKLILEAKNGRDIYIDSDLRSRRSLMHEFDLADWIIELSKLDGVNIWNVSGIDSPSLMEISEEIANFFSVEVRQNSSVKKIEDYYPSSLENELKLGLNYKYTWKEALLETAQFVKGL